MEFSFTDDQRAVAELAGQIFAAHGSDDHIAELSQSGVTFDAPLWAQLAESGLVNLVLSSANGGSELGMTELALVLEQQGRHIALAPLWQHLLVSLTLEKFAIPALQARLLPALSSGEQRAAIASEIFGQVEQGTLPSATRSANGWVLKGNIPAVLLDDAQSVLLIAAITDAGPRLFAIPSDLKGMSRVPGLFTDLQQIGDLAFADAVVGDDCILAADALAWLEPRLALAIASVQLGVIDEMLKRAAAYITERKQFGRPLGTFQALAVRAADSYIEVELLRSAVWQLAWRLDQGLPATEAGRVAKYATGQAGYIVGHTALHFHGGIGADLRYPIHRFYLKASGLAFTGGNVEVQLARMGKDLATSAYEGYLYE